MNSLSDSAQNSADQNLDTSSLTNALTGVLDSLSQANESSEMYVNGISSAKNSYLTASPIAVDSNQAQFTDWMIHTSPDVSYNGIIDDGIYSRINRDGRPAKNIELKLLDGSHVIARFSFNDIRDISEHEKNGRKFTLFSYVNRSSDVLVNLEVDCRLSAFMRLIDMEYTPWSKTMMELSVKEGESIN